MQLTWSPWLDELKQATAVRDRRRTRLAVEGLLDAGARLGGHWRGISELMRISGELSLAQRALDAWLAETTPTPQSMYSKVVLLTQAGRMQEAHALMENLPADVPDAAGHAYVRGNTALSLGQVAQAKQWLHRSVLLRPGWGPAWLTLASTTNLSQDPLGELLLAHGPAAQHQGPADLARYHYALGKLRAEQGESDLAFDAFARGAQLLRSETPYSRAGDAANAQAAMQGFDGDLIERLGAARQRSSARPIFVTGLPRSGTTLVEQILASHSQVAHGAELNLMQHLAVEAGGVSGQALQAFLDAGRGVDDLTELYLHLLQERFGTAGRVVDKSIDMSRFMGLIAAALPEAPIIWMRRDPLDNAWSCLRTFFIHGVGWSYDLQDIAEHFKLEDRLLAFWKQRLGARLLILPYAELVADPETWTRKLLLHCNLPEEPAVFTPHATQRVVMTASALQVRRPINRDGLNVAAPYKQRMQAFCDAYFEAAGPQ